MRVLFILLVANIGFALWQVFAPRAPDRISTDVSAAGDLRLLNERDSAGVVPAAAVAAELKCYSIGPLADEDLAAQVRSTIARAGHRVSARRQEQLEPLGWWVYLPPASDLAAAQALGERLAEKGVSDFVFVVGAEKANAVSLGLFPDRAKAMVRVAQLRSLGFEPQLEERYTRQVVTTLNVGPVAALPPAAREHRWAAVDCQPEGD